MINRQNSVINSGDKIRPLIFDSTKFNLGDYNLMFALYGASYNQNFYRLLDPTYLKLSMYQVKESKNNPGFDNTINEIKNIPFKLWDNRFNSTFKGKDISSFGFNNTICPDTTDLLVCGNSFSSEYNYFFIQIDKCTDESYCK